MNRQHLRKTRQKSIVLVFLGMIEKLAEIKASGEKWLIHQRALGYHRLPSLRFTGLICAGQPAAISLRSLRIVSSFTRDRFYHHHQRRFEPASLICLNFQTVTWSVNKLHLNSYVRESSLFMNARSKIGPLAIIASV